VRALVRCGGSGRCGKVGLGGEDRGLTENMNDVTMGSYICPVVAHYLLKAQYGSSKIETPR
jgi:hypothetical protein